MHGDAESKIQIGSEPVISSVLRTCPGPLPARYAHLRSISLIIRYAFPELQGSLVLVQSRHRRAGLTEVFLIRAIVHFHGCANNLNYWDQSFFWERKYRDDNSRNRPKLITNRKAVRECSCREFKPNCKKTVKYWSLPSFSLKVSETFRGDSERI